MFETATTSPNFVEIPMLNNPFNAKRQYDPAPSCVDFNGDGSVDCAVGFAGDFATSGIWFVNNVGTKATPAYVEEDGRGVNPLWKDPMGLASRYGHRVTCADLDGNGLIDCIVVREDTCVITYLNNTGTKERPQLTPLSASANPFLDKTMLLSGVTNGRYEGDPSHYNETYCPYRMAENGGAHIPVPIKGAMSPACADFDLDGGRSILSVYRFSLYRHDSLDVGP